MPPDCVPGDAALSALRGALGAAGESGTNFEAALAAACGAARDRFDPGAMNRLLLITDGVANLGDVVPESLARSVAGLRAAGIGLDVVAAGTRDLVGRVLEALARSGDGRHFLIENASAGAAAFAEQIAGAFRPATKNVKIQLRVNPERVEAWPLPGFDRHGCAGAIFVTTA